MVMEAREDRARAQETFKQAILSADPQKYLPLLYPETRQEVTADNLSTEDLMEGAGTWEMPDEMDPAEAARLLQDMVQNGGGSMTLADVEQFE